MSDELFCFVYPVGLMVMEKKRKKQMLRRGSGVFYMPSVGQDRAETELSRYVRPIEACREGAFFAEGGCCHSRGGKWRGGDNVGVKEGQDMSSEEALSFFCLFFAFQLFPPPCFVHSMDEWQFLTCRRRGW